MHAYLHGRKWTIDADKELPEMEDIMILKLKPCPFCGGKAEIEKGNCDVGCRIVCKGCGARSRFVTIDIDYCATEKAAELWNARELNS